MITSKSAVPGDPGDGDRFCASTAKTNVKKRPRQKRFRFIVLIQEALCNDVDLKTQGRQHASLGDVQHESAAGEVATRRSRALHVVCGGSSNTRVVLSPWVTERM